MGPKEQTKPVLTCQVLYAIFKEFEDFELLFHPLNNIA